MSLDASRQLAHSRIPDTSCLIVPDIAPVLFENKQIHLAAASRDDTQQNTA